MLVCGVLLGLPAVTACEPDRSTVGSETRTSIATTTTATTTTVATTTVAGTIVPDATRAPGSVVPDRTDQSDTNDTGTDDTGTNDTGTTTVPVVGDPVVTAREVGRFRQPVDLVARPADTALHIVEQGGRVIRWEPDSGDERTVLDVSDAVATGGEQGLLGLAFSLDGDSAYTNMTRADDGATVITEYAVDDDGTFDGGTARELLVIEQPFSNHNAGDLVVDGDGLLMIPVGDGGSGGDPLRVAHDPTSLLGSIVRIDPTPSPTAPYSIPADNPFADGPVALGDSTVAGAPEVFAWGLRNPWKIALDPVNGDLWVPDVGQDRFEEINLVGPVADRRAGWGVDFGWSAVEGTERFNADVPATPRATPPILTYPHGPDGCSVSGGVPYRGTAIPDLSPAFVYSDFCSGTIRALDVAGARVIDLARGFDSVTAVRADGNGELYVLEAGGGVHRLGPG